MLPRYHQDQQGRQDATHCVPMDALISLEGSILEGQTLNKQGHEVRVTVIQGGQSRNGFVYDEPTLQQLASLLEGAQAYADHDTSASVRSVRDMVGFYTNVSYVPPSPDTTHAHGRVDATLHILEAAAWLWSIIYEAVSIGKPDLVGLSIDIFGQWSQDASSTAKHVTSVRQINSCDIVTRPSAGGSFQRILHSEDKGDLTHMDPITIPPIPASNGDETPPQPTPPGGASHAACWNPFCHRPSSRRFANATRGASLRWPIWNAI